MGAPAMAEIVFEVRQATDGTWSAECLSEDIDAEADSREDLHARIRQAVKNFRGPGAGPQRIRLRLVRDEVLMP